MCIQPIRACMTRRRPPPGHWVPHRNPRPAAQPGSYARKARENKKLLSYPSSPPPSAPWRYLRLLPHTFGGSVLAKQPTNTETLCPALPCYPLTDSPPLCAGHTTACDTCTTPLLDSARKERGRGRERERGGESGDEPSLGRTHLLRPWANTEDAHLRGEVNPPPLGSEHAWPKRHVPSLLSCRLFSIRFIYISLSFVVSSRSLAQPAYSSPAHTSRDLFLLAAGPPHLSASRCHPGDVARRELSIQPGDWSRTPSPKCKFVALGKHPSHGAS